MTLRSLVFFFPLVKMKYMLKYIFIRVCVMIKMYHLKKIFASEVNVFFSDTLLSSYLQLWMCIIVYIYFKCN